jgi:hypothetical protein
MLKLVLLLTAVCRADKDGDDAHKKMADEIASQDGMVVTEWAPAAGATKPAPDAEPEPEAKCETSALPATMGKCMEDVPSVTVCLEDATKTECGCMSAPEFITCLGPCWSILQIAVCSDHPAADITPPAAVAPAPADQPATESPHERSFGFDAPEAEVAVEAEVPPPPCTAARAAVATKKCFASG